MSSYYNFLVFRNKYFQTNTSKFQQKIYLYSAKYFFSFKINFRSFLRVKLQNYVITLRSRNTKLNIKQKNFVLFYEMILRFWQNYEKNLRNFTTLISFVLRFCIIKVALFSEQRLRIYFNIKNHYFLLKRGWHVSLP